MQGQGQSDYTQDNMYHMHKVQRVYTTVNWQLVSLLHKESVVGAILDNCYTFSKAVYFLYIWYLFRNGIWDIE